MLVSHHCTHYKKRLKYASFSLAIICTFTGCRFFFFLPVSTPPYGHLQKADEFTQQERYSDAIDQYRAHIEERLALQKRPDWENPYFYLLLIGDLQLADKKPDEALHTYQSAEEKQVDRFLVYDRYRSVASYYLKENKFKEALDILSRFRHCDPLIFDAMSDRVAKEYTSYEESHTSAIPMPSVDTERKQSSSTDKP